MRADRQPVAEVVVAILARTPMTGPQLSARLGKQAQPTLVRLLAQGRIQCVENDTDAMTRARVYRAKDERTA